MSKAGRLSKCSGCDGDGWLAHVDGRVDCAVAHGAGRVMIAANDNGRATSPRDAARDIAALLRSGHVEAGGALPIQQRVQTSGRGEPQLPRWSAESERAQRILGRGYAEGGEARRCALALWLIHAEHVEPLALGLGVLLSTDHARRLTVREWARWGVGGSADSLAASAVELIGRAVGWYDSASEEPGCAGEFARLLADADGVRDTRGVVARLREWHARWCAEREDCAALPRRVRCEGARAARTAIEPQPRCEDRAFPWSSRPRRDYCKPLVLEATPRATERRVAT